MSLLYTSLNITGKDDNENIAILLFFRNIKNLVKETDGSQLDSISLLLPLRMITD